jgi:hypothetical protein
MFNGIFTGASLATGFAIQNSSDPALYDQLVFVNFAHQNGYVYHADFGDLLSARTKLDPTDPSLDEPDELSQAAIHRLRLSLDDDNNPATAPLLFDDLSLMLGTIRNDVRLWEGTRGEMYLSSKRNGVIYEVVNSLPLIGDYSKNGAVDAADLVVWRDSFGASGVRPTADGNGDGIVDGADLLQWQRSLGDASGSGPGLSRVPEASSHLLAATIVILLGKRGRHRQVPPHFVHELASGRPRDLRPAPGMPASFAEPADFLQKIPGTPHASTPCNGC